MTTSEIIKKQLENLSPSSQEITPNQFENEVLSPEEEQEALRLARQKKSDERTRNEYFERLNKTDFWSEVSARDLYDALKQTKSQLGARFEIKKWNKEVIFDLCLYFANDKRFEKRNDSYSLSKGIMLMGNPGVGKSHLMSFFSKNPHTSYSHVTCKAIAERYRTGWKRDDLDTLEWYSYPLKAEHGHIYGQTQLGYCFGDLGTEDEKKNFGNSMNVMEHIIFQRYENKLPFNLTHITTNLNAGEIEQFYGLRIRDRVREMFNVIKFPNESGSFR